MSKLPPRRPGFFLLRGTRHIREAMYEHMSEPVQVVEYVSDRGKELAVQMIGRREKFPLARFTGEWTEIDTEAP